MQRRKTILALTATALLLVGIVAHPRADLQLQMHDPSDLAPHRMQAAVDIGVVAVSLLVTWTSRLAR